MAPQMQFMPPPQQRFQPPPMRSSRPAQPQTRAAANGRYLPAMPEMLRAAPQSQPATPRYAQQEQKPAPAVATAQPGNLVIRGQMPDEPQVPAKPAKLVIPTPEEMGLVHAPAAQPAEKPFDWATARDRLEHMGAAHYRLEKATDGWCFVCALPHPTEPMMQRHFEARAASDTEAIRTVLRQVEDWKRGQ